MYEYQLINTIFMNTNIYTPYQQVVDTASGALVVDLQAHEGAVWSLAVRPDGKGFVTASADKEVKFWDFTVRTCGCLRLRTHAYLYVYVYVSPYTCVCIRTHLSIFVVA